MAGVLDVQDLTEYRAGVVTLEHIKDRRKLKSFKTRQHEKALEGVCPLIPLHTLCNPLFEHVMLLRVLSDLCRIRFGSLRQCFGLQRLTYSLSLL